MGWADDRFRVGKRKEFLRSLYSLELGVFSIILVELNKSNEAIRSTSSQAGDARYAKNIQPRFDWGVNLTRWPSPLGKIDTIRVRGVIRALRRASRQSAAPCWPLLTRSSPVVTLKARSVSTAGWLMCQGPYWEGRKTVNSRVLRPLKNTPGFSINIRSSIICFWDSKITILAFTWWV